MKAAVFTTYGPPEAVLNLREVEKPVPKDNEALIRVHAAGVNFVDWAFVRGEPFLARLWSGLREPKHTIPGADIAGRVEAVGGNVKQLQPGDEVFGDIGDYGLGGFAEYVAAPERALALKPAGVTFEQAAAVPQAAVVALQGLRDRGQVQPGQKVLIIGASGGIGTFAVQIAKAFGAEVTGVCGTRNLGLLRTIGADQVIDYTQEDFARNAQRYDLIFDIHANRPLGCYMRVLRPGGQYLACAFNPVALILGALISKLAGKKVGSLTHKPNARDLVVMKELLEAEKVKPVIDKCYPLREAAEAVRYYGGRHARGKVVITMEHNGN
jgi:NADPH:quinone reductase-like Zn-dependent oxidoreductase